MAGAAGFSLLHVGHGGTLAVLAGPEYRAVAIIAFEQGQVVLVVELYRSCFLDTEINVYGGFVAFFAITLSAESGIPLMTCAAGFTLLQLCHPVANVVWSGIVQLVMAIIAGKHIQVPVMAEPGVVCKYYVFDWMALATPLFHTKGGFIIMAGTTGFPLLHVGHGISPGCRSGGKNRVMAFAAGKHGAVFVVAERDRAGVFDAEINVVDFARMTLVAIGGNTKNINAVMTGTAGFSLFHLRHGIAHASDPTDENITVAIAAPEQWCVLGMAEVGVEFLENDLLHRLVAFLAITLDRKCGFAIVTGTAGEPLFHVIHGAMHAVRTWCE